MTAEPIADADAAIRKLLESLLISYSLDLEKSTFTLVTDYPERAEGAQRTFIALRFSGVRDFRREPGNLTELAVFTDTYSVDDNSRAIVIQHLRTTGDSSARAVELWFGMNFGGVAFAYESVAGFLRHTRAEERNGNWVYCDACTGEPVNFARPFAGVVLR